LKLFARDERREASAWERGQRQAIMHRGEHAGT
jgi:hypothetical protein